MNARRLFVVLALLAAAVPAASCGAGGEHDLVITSMRSEILGKEMPYATLPPPPVKAGDPQETHVVYFLHGLGRNHASLDEKGLSGRLLAAEAEGRIPRVVVVAPEGERGFYINWHDGSKRYEDYLMDEVLPNAERALGLEVPRERRHVIGVSMGGYGALQLGLRHPEAFESIASISGALFDREEAIQFARKVLLNWAIDIRRMIGDGTDREFIDGHNPYSLIERLEPARRPRIFLAVGSEEPDALHAATIDFHAFLDEKGVTHTWAPFQGGHDWESWAPVIEKAIVHAVRGDAAVAP